MAEGGKKKALLLTDDKSAATVARKALLSSGFTVDTMSLNDAVGRVEFKEADIVVICLSRNRRTDVMKTALRIRDSSDAPMLLLADAPVKELIRYSGILHPVSVVFEPHSIKTIQFHVEMLISTDEFRGGKEIRSAIDSSGKAIFVRDGSLFRRVNLHVVNYVEAQGSYCRIVTNERMYTLSYNLSQFEKAVKYSDFVRVHRSFLVNALHVEALTSGQVVVAGKHIPISKMYGRKVTPLFLKL